MFVYWPFGSFISVVCKSSLFIRKSYLNGLRQWKFCVLQVIHLLRILHWRFFMHPQRMRWWLIMCLHNLLVLLRPGSVLHCAANSKTFSAYRVRKSLGLQCFNVILRSRFAVGRHSHSALRISPKGLWFIYIRRNFTLYSAVWSGESVNWWGPSEASWRVPSRVIDRWS